MKNAVNFNELELFYTLINNSDILYTIHSRAGDFEYASPSFLDLTGYKKEELMSVSLFDLLHPEEKELFSRVDLTQSHKNQYFRVCRREGDYVWLESTLIPRIGNDKPDVFICISKDATEQVDTKIKLEEHKEQYRLLVENFIDTVGIISRDGNVIYINDAGRKLFGVARKEEVIGRHIFDYLDPQSRKSLEDQLEQNQLSETFELTVTRHDKQIKHVVVKLIPTKYRSRDVFQIIITDITEKLKAEETIARTEKLSVVGQLAAGIAHEIRNPLTVIKGFTQMLKQEENNEYLDVVLSELMRIEGIISDLLILAKPQPSKKEKLNLKELLENTILFFQSEAILHDVMIQTSIEAFDVFIEGEADKLKQVFINVLKNAVEAMPNGGNLYVSTEKIEDDIFIIKIKDTGVGIPEERIKKLGEPFFSTKEKGTGLGLMISNRIIKNHGGSLEIDSKLNEGTTISIILPIISLENE
ncbi:PAS domain S-box protein [Bacillus sp. IITD106]|nr:PAS domain S-box protein [Bacillus sp. IITD106]